MEEADSEWEDGLDEAIEASKQESKSDAHANSGTDADGDMEMPDAVGSETISHEAEASTTAQLPIDNESIALEGQNNQASASGGPVAPVSVPSATLTPPRPIPARKTSPSGRYELGLGQIVADGPMTPRNDAGPFVLDGGAGQSSAGRERGSTVSLANPTTGDDRA